MHVTLQPGTQQFIDEQVKTGRYPTADAVVEAALAELQSLQSEELDEATVAAIREAEAQGDRGEGMDLDTYRRQFAARTAKR